MREQWQIDQGNRCPCRGSDEYCVCQNRYPGDGDLTEEWLASVGFKYREPGERQSFRHWTLTFHEPDDYGLYLETTMPGWLNKDGEHVNKDGGWFLWMGRSDLSCFLHLRHIHTQREMIAIVEALAGQPWKPTKAGHVPVISKRRVTGA